MKSKELIRQLQEYDPTGETEVCIHNADIHYISVEPAYWDGRLQVLVRDKSKEPYFSIVGAKYVTKGDKICLNPMSIQDLIGCEQDGVKMDIDYSALGEPRATELKQAHEKTREIHRDIDLRCEMNMFHRWVMTKATAVNPDATADEVKDYSDGAFKRLGLSPNDPLIELPTKTDKHGTWHASVNDRRFAQWDNTIDVSWTGLDYKIQLKETVS
jgi:hypothetical protein